LSGRLPSNINSKDSTKKNVRLRKRRVTIELVKEKWSRQGKGTQERERTTAETRKEETLTRLLRSFDTVVDLNTRN
jgi:hypothetical protein